MSRGNARRRQASCCCCCCCRWCLMNEVRLQLSGSSFDIRRWRRRGGRGSFHWSEVGKVREGWRVRGHRRPDARVMTTQDQATQSLWVTQSCPRLHTHTTDGGRSTDYSLQLVRVYIKGVSKEGKSHSVPIPWKNTVTVH